MIKTTKPVGVLADGGALGMPCTVPVPKDYAQKYDKGKQSTYGQHQVFTGPYMIETYEPSKKLVMVRNPSWDKSTDFKPAYFDKINITCCTDATVAARKTLTGQRLPERRLRGSARVGAEVGAVVAQGPARRSSRAAATATSR